MDKETTTFGLCSEKLVRLLNIGTDISETDNNIDQKGKKTVLLQDWLAAKLPLDAVFLETLPAILKRFCKQLRPHAGESFGNLLKDPKTDMLVIKKIKDYSKKIALSAKSEAEHDAAIAIYFAAIANALFFHEQKITTFSYKSLDESFSKLINETWITKDIAELFSKACKVCRQKSKGK